MPDVDETEDTLEGNAALKARALAATTGQPAIADDTGLFVDALGGRPGVRSARYSGEGATYASNVALLLEELAGVAPPRRARFRTVVCAAWPDGRELVVRGELAGSIAAAPRGESGFGYDPVFEPDDAPGRTLAELSAAEKNALSHRGRALELLSEVLADAHRSRDVHP